MKKKLIIMIFILLIMCMCVSGQSKAAYVFVGPDHPNYDVRGTEIWLGFAGLYNLRSGNSTLGSCELDSHLWTGLDAMAYAALSMGAYRGWDR